MADPPDRFAAGTIAESGVVFDSTRGVGLTYRDGGLGVLRPLALRLGGSPLPGICAGLQSALTGMTVGGRRVVLCPPELAFGAQAAAAPYAIVPPNSAVRYEVELLRLSRRGPDALFKGLSKCSQGGASATTENCAAIEPAEFV
ncbi:peptidyl-prolyl cis-trans isomerase, FKBP-type [Monoraphidium neglectum]|uniref:peptidylprolyl isomerase n=1 Tax=Monoraphidium neglectum TaxID=145388 RepID=A0A0D2M2M3_9CHLO|nr:peptidyl-prolyl cis-trans isomerase, FKBP-type [Monoraphidium neglectum]KIY97894.1 peptidyl-prolyl cis-trans isomerase, FKBP-type [Monoraphidium neglectum]|eukprot:XP_013896914.1 peptidyl-prolyl cis-trans isomerase, FKBP-type [Monoraphidium neglectum]